MENKNIFISEYLQDISKFYSELFESYSKDIIEKIKNNEKLDEFELYFVVFNLNLVKGLNK